MINRKKFFAVMFAASLMTNVTFAEETNTTSKIKVEGIEATSELKADEIEYDMETQKAVATNNVDVHHKIDDGKKTFHLVAEKVEYDMEAQIATATGNVDIQHEDKEKNETTHLVSNEAEYNFGTQQAKASGQVNAQHQASGKESSYLEADEIEYHMNTQDAKATGDVHVQHQEEPGKEPAELNADIVEYSVSKGIINAVGNVLLRQGTARATGLRAMYNTQTQEAYLIDDVIAVRDDVRITCDKLLSDGTGHMQADGNVYGVQTVAPNEKYPAGDRRTFLGDHVDYYPNDKKHVVIPAGGLVTSSDGDFTADFMEGWLDEEYYIGTGNAHAISPPNDMEAGGDKVEYFGKNGGKAVMTGNAWAIQDNNTMRGNRITVYLDDSQNLNVKPEPTPKSEELSAQEVEVFEREKNSGGTNN